MITRNTIMAALRHLEETQHIKIIYACESGSRAWGFASPDSDWDVRYIYVRDPKWYIAIDTGRDVIDGYHKLEGIAGHPEFDNPLLDITGWDIKKAFMLARKSNPALVEWLNSPIIYLPTEQDFLKEAIKPVTRLYPALEHYRAMARGNMREYLQGETVRYKKYLYVLRPILAAQWITEIGTFPPVEFHSLMGVLSTYKKDILGYNIAEVKQALLDLLQVKSLSSEVDERPRNEVLHAFIVHELARKDKVFDDEPEDKTTHLNKQFRRVINKYWNE
jgi:predicted nucleotidyltransferase